MAPRDREREQLERELENGEYRELLLLLRERHPFMRRFRSWGEAIAFLRKGPAQDPLKDEVVRPVLQAHAEASDPRWRTILLVAVWPRLKAACLQRRLLDADLDELWACMVWNFLQTVTRLDLARRPERLLQKLLNDTTWRVSDDYRRAHEQAGIETPHDPETVEYLAGTFQDPGLSMLETRDELEVAIANLRRQMDAGRISEEGFHLLIGTLVYGKTLHDCAREMGLTYEAAKKRRQRAEAAILRMKKSP